MRHLLLLLFLGVSHLFFPPSLRAQSGSQNISLASNWYFPGQELSNVWGYSAAGREYALVGVENGTTILDITNPFSPTFIVHVPGNSSFWREIKTYQNYAYVVTESVSPSPHGVQIINLSALPSSSITYKNYITTATGGGSINKAHALQVDEAAGMLYLFGTNQFSGSALVLDLKPVSGNPSSGPYFPIYKARLTYAGTAGNHTYVHDGYANGNLLYSSHIYAGQFLVAQYDANSNTLAQVPNSAGINTPGNFTHNTWRSGNTLFTTDEVSGSFLAAYDIADVTNISTSPLDKIGGLTSGSIVHNTYIKDDYAVTSWYKDGIAIVDASRPANLVRVGYYDSFNGTGNGFSGCWGVYPYFPSGTIIASNITSSNAGHTADGELLILSPTYTRACYLEGLITNAATGNPLSGATVQLLSTSLSESTPINGLYKMGQVTPGTFTLQVSKSGYNTYTTSVTLANGTLTTVNVALQLFSLPVELARFDATLVGKNEALLTWTTASERGSAGFEIEHSINATDWETMGWEPGAGDSDTERQYNWRSAALTPGTHYFRLGQRDLDGGISYSDWRSVTVGGGKIHAVLAPNPSRGQATTLTLSLNDLAAGATADLVHWQLLDAQMRPVSAWSEHSLDESDGAFTATLPVDDLPAGTYFVLIQNGAEQQVLPLVRY